MLDQPFIILILLGFFFKAAGFMMRGELLFRCLLLIGTLCDIAIVMLTSTGLSTPFLSHAMLFAINLVVIGIILWERTTWFMSKNERAAFSYFKTLTPGQFRQVIRKARWTVAPKDTQLLHEDQQIAKLFFLETEKFMVSKQGKSYEAKGPAFLGEIMLLQGEPASADVTVPKGAIYAEWQTAELRRMMKKSRALDNALVARFGHDLADKVRHSVPMDRADTPKSPSSS